jgi:hypothetical protein
MADFNDINNPYWSGRPPQEEPEQSQPPASDEGGEQEETGAATAELRLLSACFEPHPIHGYTVNKYCRVSGTAEFLARTSHTRCSLRLFSIFQGEQDTQVRQEDLQIDPQKYGSCTIDTESGTFCFTDVPLYIPQGYPDRESFITPIRYTTPLPDKMTLLRHDSRIDL